MYRTALTVTGLVTLIACYNYFRIFSSWQAAFTIVNGVIKPSGLPFNDALRYVDWVLTVPLLLVELILVMRLSRSETVSRATTLGILAAIMVGLGYPGEISSDAGTRRIWWALAMIPFLIIVYDLFVGLKTSIAAQPDGVRGMVSNARWLTVISWCFYPIVFVFPMIGFTGGGAEISVQLGHTVADVVAKVMFGVFIHLIAACKSQLEYGATAMAGSRAAAE